MAGCNEYRNESSGTRKGGEFVDLPMEFFSSQGLLHGYFYPCCLLRKEIL